MDEPYSKRELDTSFEAIATHLKNQDEILLRIEVQTTKTNGRVNKLEWWRTAVVFLVTTICGAMMFVAPYAVGVIKDEINYSVNDSVTTSWNKVLSDYNINVTN